jgi:hypothetical protein
MAARAFTLVPAVVIAVAAVVNVQVQATRVRAMPEPSAVTYLAHPIRKAPPRPRPRPRRAAL